MRGVHGYTLVEIVLVLFIIALVAGSVMQGLGGWVREARLRQEGRVWMEWALTARRLALEQQRTFAITLRGREMTLEPNTADGIAVSEGEPALESLPSPREVAQSLEVSWLRWPEEVWRSLASKQGQEVKWFFQSNGLAEPMAWRFQEGEAELELYFDPLTATVREERYVFP